MWRGRARASCVADNGFWVDYTPGMSSARKRLRWYTVRPAFLLVVGAVLVLLGLGYRRYNPPMGDGPAGPAVPADAFARPWSDGEVLLVGMGDSIVTGFGAPKGFGFFDLLVSNPPGDQTDMAGLNLRRAFPRLRVLNIATNSTSSGDHLRSQLLFLPPQPAEVKGVVVLSTGGIDLIHDYGSKPARDEAVYGASWEDGRRYAALFRGRLEQLLDEISSRFPGGCEIFVATIFDPTDGVGDIQNVNPVLRLVKPLPAWPDGLKVHGAFNDHIRAAAAARRNVHAVEVHKTLLGHGLHCRDAQNPHYHADDPGYWLYFNLEDPNQRGYDAIRRVFLLDMIKVLAPAPPSPMGK